MVAAHSGDADAHKVVNRVVGVLTLYGSTFKSFGSILILVLNRESMIASPFHGLHEFLSYYLLTSLADETSLQILILKLLYLLFTNPPTFEYFYTNDLRVLVDVIVRNLLDLPASSIPLRNMYLRILHPLLEYTQLKQAPHYKREELRRLLAIMSGAGSEGGHFGMVDETTQRLVARCRGVAWLELDGHVATVKHGGLLGVGIPGAMTSALSVVEVTTQREKPGVQTPSRGKMDERTGGDDVDDGDEDGALLKPHDGRRGTGGAGEKSPFEVEDEA